MLLAPKACLRNGTIASPSLLRLNRWQDRTQSLCGFVSEGMRSFGASTLADRLDGLMRAGKVLFLLDGLNELPEFERPTGPNDNDDPRAMSIRTTLENQDGINVACVLTCRPHDFTGEPRWRDLHVLRSTRHRCMNSRGPPSATTKPPNTWRHNSLPLFMVPRTTARNGFDSWQSSPLSHEAAHAFLHAGRRHVAGQSRRGRRDGG